MRYYLAYGRKQKYTRFPIFKIRYGERNRGFTLIELSIVLAIIGLVVGGILVGRDLIRAAEFHSVVKQLQEYEMAWNTFQLKYNCLAGDCKDASSFLSGEIDGNGDGVVNMWSTYGNVESLQVWSQWAAAGLIKGKYSSPAGNWDISLNTTSPTTTISPTVGYTLYTQFWLTRSKDYSLQIGSFGITNPGWKDFLWGAGFNAEQAYSIDQKIDDGNPQSGKFTSADPDEPSATNANITCLSGNAYLLTDPNTGCSSYYLVAK